MAVPAAVPAAFAKREIDRRRPSQHLRDRTFEQPPAEAKPERLVVKFDRSFEIRNVDVCKQ
jgi:hypothetical protein